MKSLFNVILDIFIKGFFQLTQLTGGDCDLGFLLPVPAMTIFHRLQY